MKSIPASTFSFEEWLSSFRVPDIWSGDLGCP